MVTKLNDLDQEMADLLLKFLINNFTTIEQITYQEKTLGTQIFLLHFLSTSSDTSMKSIAKFLKVPASTATRKVDYLENLKLVSRQISRKDRRIFEIKLTSAGKNAYDSIFVNQNHRIRKLLSHFSLGELEIGIKILKLINTNLSC